MGHELMADPAASRVEMDMPLEIGQDKGQACPGKIFSGDIPKHFWADVGWNFHSRKPASLYNKFLP
jgi:hypothetical protein